MSIFLAINLYPQQKKLNDAILETVKYLNWTRYAIIYEGNDALFIRPARLNYRRKLVGKQSIVDGEYWSEI